MIASFYCTQVVADTHANQKGLIKIAVSKQGNKHLNKPSNGLSQEAVKHRFGKPLSQQKAVGSPPISRWTYKDFAVYFEHKQVIHSVALAK